MVQVHWLLQFGQAAIFSIFTSPVLPHTMLSLSHAVRVTVTSLNLFPSMITAHYGPSEAAGSVHW